LPGTSLLNIYIDVELQRFEMPHKMGKHLAIDMLAQAPRVESSDTPVVLPGGPLESGCSSNGQRMAVGQFFQVPFSFAASLFPGDTRLRA